MCCSASGYTKEEINGECEDCGEETINGNAYECCSYSPTLCNTCGYSPCDLSC